MELGFIIRDLCFDFGSGYPEKDEDNFDGSEWFNLSFWDFSYTIGNMTLNSVGDLESPCFDRVYLDKGEIYERLVFESRYPDDFWPETQVYHPGEWEQIIRCKHWENYERQQLEFRFMKFMRPGETIDLSEIVDGFE